MVKRKMRRIGESPVMYTNIIHTQSIVQLLPIRSKNLTEFSQIPTNEIPFLTTSASLPSLLSFQGLMEHNIIDHEREMNLKCYNQKKDDLFKNYKGKYVVISKGHLQQIGDSFDEVKDVSMDTNHRFIFKVEHKKKPKGILRWPKKLKK